MVTDQILLSLQDAVQSNESIKMQDFKYFIKYEFLRILHFLRNKSLTKKNVVPIKSIFIDFQKNVIVAEKVLFKYISVELCLFESYLEYLEFYFNSSLDNVLKEDGCNSFEIVRNNEFISKFYFFRKLTTYENVCVAHKEISNKYRYDLKNVKSNATDIKVYESFKNKTVKLLEHILKTIESHNNLFKHLNSEIFSNYITSPVSVEIRKCCYEFEEEYKEIKRSIDKINECKRNKPQLIYFIHGLSGEPKKTWGKFGKLIKKDKKLKEKFQIKYFDYKTYLFPKLRSRLFKWIPLLGKFFHDIRNEDIEFYSKLLSSDLSIHEDNYDEIHIICHSLGGIICLYYLIKQAKNIQGYLKNYRSVIFFAVPFKGSSYANLRTMIAGRDTLISQLQTDSPLLKNLNMDWKGQQISSRIDTYIFGGHNDNFVPCESLKEIIDEHGLRPSGFITDKTHKSIVKPKNHDDKSFIYVKNILQKSI